MRWSREPSLPLRRCPARHLERRGQGGARRYAGFALIGAAQGAAGLFMVLAAGTPACASWPWIAASVALHVVYTALLARSYELGDFNQVYPLARGVRRRHRAR
ncbi:hypothetical protein [Actinoallomurus acaciae]|uniref:DUF418 domain-containing protein n=1 Tax=Actinoallomurus acaciae TaxID=502577 RepID=A0ABV5Z026_9ACTN